MFRNAFLFLLIIMLLTTKQIVFHPVAGKILKYFKINSASCRLSFHKCFFLVSSFPHFFSTDVECVSLKLTPKKGLLILKFAESFYLLFAQRYLPAF